MTRNVTEKKVVALWQTMREKYGAELKPKRKSKIMKAVAKAMNWLHMVNKKRMTGQVFMASVWTTVGRTICFPAGVVIGQGSQAELLDQADKAVHECTHVLQRVGVKYLFSPARVAKIETDAFIASMEIQHWLTGRVPDPVKTAEALRAYGCNEAQIQYAEKKYRKAVSMISRGNYRSDTVRTAIKVLEG